MLLLSAWPQRRSLRPLPAARLWRQSPCRVRSLPPALWWLLFRLLWPLLVPLLLLLLLLLLLPLLLLLLPLRQCHPVLLELWAGLRL